MEDEGVEKRAAFEAASGFEAAKVPSSALLLLLTDGPLLVMTDVLCIAGPAVVLLLGVISIGLEMLKELLLLLSAPKLSPAEVVAFLVTMLFLGAAEDRGLVEKTLLLAR